MEIAGVSSIEDFRSRIIEAVKIDPDVKIGYGPAGEKLKMICTDLDNKYENGFLYGRASLENQFEEIVRDSANNMQLSRMVEMLEDFEAKQAAPKETLTAKQEEAPEPMQFVNQAPVLSM